MALFMRPDFCSRKRWTVTPAVLFLLFVPMVCMASTPPLQPSLLFEVSNTHVSQDATLLLPVTGNGYVSYNKPPEQIMVDVFFVPNGSRLGTFPVPRTGSICTSEKTCLYGTSVGVKEFPTGTFMLIASDPLSGAKTRQMISVPLQGKGNIGFFKQAEHDLMFWITSVVLGAFVTFILAILVRDKTLNSPPSE